MPVNIIIVRHAQGYHNLPGNKDMYDPLLTPWGRMECAIQQRLVGPYMNHIYAVVASPMKRTISTAILTFLPISQYGHPIYLLPELQETGREPSGIGNSRANLELEFGKRVDASRVEPGWNIKNSTTKWDCNLEKIEARAREARIYLRQLAAEAPANQQNIAVVTHGTFAHYLTQDFGGVTPSGSTAWSNCQAKFYQFADPTGQDPEATLRETADSIEQRAGIDWFALSPKEQAQYKGYLVKHNFGKYQLMPSV